MNKTAIVIDLDGTLFQIKHRLHHVQRPDPDYPAFHAACINDTIEPGVGALIELLVNVPEQKRPLIVLMTARPDTYAKATMVCLEKYGIPYDRLLMRGVDEHGKDADLKLQMLHLLRDNAINVLFAVEDRPSVVRMWRTNGVPCFACDDSDWLQSGDDN